MYHTIIDEMGLLWSIQQCSKIGEGAVWSSQQTTQKCNIQRNKNLFRVLWQAGIFKEVNILEIYNSQFYKIISHKTIQKIYQNTQQPTD